MTKSPFEPGEIAVLPNDVGARLFEVGACQPQPFMAEFGEEPRWKVVEKNTRPGQPDFDVWWDRLVKVENRDKAVALVAVLRHIHEDAQSRHRALLVERDKAARRAIQDHQVPDFKTYD